MSLHRKLNQRERMAYATLARQEQEIIELRVQLAKAMVDLKEINDACEKERTHVFISCLVDDAIDALSDSAEPSAPATGGE